MNDPAAHPDAGRQQADRFREIITALTAEVGRVIVGMSEVVESTLIALVCNGHVLLEGVPGLGKTMLVRTLSDALDLEFSRIQFTPDLMPADITGTTVLGGRSTGEHEFQFQAGPLFAHVVLADEINRATPKTQSALLEAMQERMVTVGGTTHRLPDPFLVFATQNPIEMEGTYPLPEAQLDRFLFKVEVPFPSLPELHEIVNRTTGALTCQAATVASRAEILSLAATVRDVPAARPIQDFALRLVLATHPDQEAAPEAVKRFVRYGSSPRGAQALILAGKARALMHGRFAVSRDDIKTIAAPALRHRLGLNFEGLAEGVDTDELIAAAIGAVEQVTRQDVPVK